MTSLSDIRSTFLDFFVRNGHEQVASSPLVPRNDPTVGYTARHHTFFEMLGNFSFGDYFKTDAIPYAWELLTKDFGINKDKLLVTVYHTDDEAADIWKKVAGLPDDRIRIGALLQGKHDNYDTDLMRALIEASANATSVDPDGDGNTHHRVIADHLRSTSFLIAEGVLPSNEGRGYVLRRIMRRAMRHAHLLGAKDPVMHKLVPELVKQMGTAYPELGQGQRLIEETLLNEEIRFKTTLDRGLKLLDDEVSGLDDGADLPGAAAFKLYDTYGFPLDLTQDALRVTETGKATITDTKKVAGIFVHIAKVTEGALKVGQGAGLAVAPERRAAIQANHSATHLLNEALRNVLGDHIAQKGSLNAPDRLRFDFSHNQAVSLEDLDQVEREVNALIRQNGVVETRIMTPDDARAMGAQALFGEKYGDEVRVVSMGTADGSGKGMGGDTYSLELCGGTHVDRLGEIGAFVTLGDSASSAGVRRIEALTGQAALDYLRAQDHRLAEVALALKAPAGDAAARVKALLDERKALTNEVAQLRREVAMGGGGDAGPAQEEINGIGFIGQVMQGVSGKDLPSLVDQFKERVGSGVVLLIADAGGKAAVAAGVTADLTDKISAVDVLRAATPALGGKGGGGRPDMAQGGGRSVENANEAIAAAKAVLEGS